MKKVLILSMLLAGVTAQAQSQKFHLIGYKKENVQFFSNDFSTKSTDAWPLEAIKADYAHQNGFKGSGVTVCLIDSGVDVYHPAIQGALVAGKNFTEQGLENDINDLQGHGTMMATVIAGRPFGGIVGVAPEAKLVVAKVVDSHGSSDLKKIEAAFAYCMNKANVINISLGGAEQSPSLMALMSQARRMGISIMAAAGNQPEHIIYPASDESVFAVGALDKGLHVPYFSPNNLKLSFFTPGVAVPVVNNLGAVEYFTGTSFSAAYASGAEAIRISAKNQV